MVELVNRPETNGSNGRATEMAWREAQGASQIGPFDYVPPMGFREYWCPGVYKKDVGAKKPAFVKMLGEDFVFFRGKADQVYALFPGTITCEYHGYTFDGEGECVAGLIDAPDTPIVGKMRVKYYPTQQHDGVVYVWMGETEPVPLEEDLSPEIVDTCNHSYKHVSEWDANWTEPVNQGIDYYEAYLHRKSFNYMGGLLSKERPFFRARIANYGGIKMVHEDEKRVCSDPANVAYVEDNHPGVNANWPRKRWYMFLGRWKRRNFSLMGVEGASLLGIPSFSHCVELPFKICTGSGSVKPAISLHMRWMARVTLETCRVWTYTIGREPKSVLGRAYKYLWYILRRKPNTITRINEWEGLVTFQKDRLRYDIPQKLSTLDTVVIYVRRHLAQRSRDFHRLGGAYGSKHPLRKELKSNLRLRP